MKRAALIAATVVAGLGLQACAPTKAVYGPIGPKVAFGYKDRLNPEGGFTVLIAMPANAKPADLRSFFDRRAGELCPGGVERTNVFRMTRNEDLGPAPYVYQGVGVSQRYGINAELEGYVYCKPAEAAPPQVSATQ